MNDTAQETTAVMARLVEHEVLGASLLPEEEKKETNTDHNRIAGKFGGH